MTGKLPKPPAGSRWVWLTLEMMKSPAWRAAGINTKRFVDFLLVEYMQHGFANNGKIKAPYGDLIQIGICRRFVNDAINAAEAIGLVDCHRGGLRVATTYTLTWLPLHDGTPASDRWRDYRNDKIKPWPFSKKARTDGR